MDHFWHFNEHNSRNKRNNWTNDRIFFFFFHRRNEPYPLVYSFLHFNPSKINLQNTHSHVKGDIFKLDILLLYKMCYLLADMFLFQIWFQSSADTIDYEDIFGKQRTTRKELLRSKKRLWLTNEIF